MDEDSGKLKVLKQKISEKSLPPNVDIIKLVYQHYAEEKTDYNKLSDEDLEKEKQRLLKQLKESESDSGKSKNKS